MTRTQRISASGGEIFASVHPVDASLGTLSAPQGNPACIEAGEAWLQSQGCTRIWGPMEGCSWFAYRACLGPSERPPFLMEPQADAGLWLAAGYSAIASYTSTLQSHDSALERLDKHRRRAEGLGFRFRSMSDQTMERDLVACHRISHGAFSSALGYAPLPQDAFVAMYTPLLKSAPKELVLIAENDGGEIVGFCLGFPEMCAPERKEMVVKSLAVDPLAQGASMGSALVAEVHARALAMGLDGGGIHALMRADSYSQNITARGGAEVFRRYALFEKTLPPVDGQT
jgi:ribosomal protein S18 acetylase RimI-like enzyme